MAGTLRIPAALISTGWGEERIMFFFLSDRIGGTIAVILLLRGCS
jgi:hypothetical protein